MNQYDHLKNKLRNYNVEIDKEKLWAKTSHAIPQRKRRRAALVILFGGLVISAWLLQSTSLFPSTGSQSSQINMPVDNHDQLTQNLQYFPIENENKWNETTHKTLDVLSPKLSRSVAKLTQTTSPPGEENILKTVTVGGIIFLENTRKQTGNTQTFSEASSKSPYENAPIVHPVGSFIPEQQAGSSGIIQKTKGNFNNSDHIASGPVDYLYKDVSQIPIPANTLVATSSHKPDIRPLRGRFLQSLQMVQGVGFSNVKIHSLTPESAPYAAELEQKLRSLEILTTSLTATVHLLERISMEAGLQFTRLSTVVDHEWETNERIKEEGVTTIIIDEQGIPQSITGNRDITRTTHYQAKRFTTHQHIDFVLALHRVIWNEQRLSLNAFVKGVYNLSYEAKGTIPDNAGELVSFSKEENPFRKNSPFAIGAGLQLNYQLNPHWSLTGNFTFDQLSYRFKDEKIPLRFQYSGLSLGLGFGYVF